MNFKADQQTLEDLNLLGKFKSDSIFGLFNQVKTKGGEKLLEQFFTQPLVSAEEINARTAKFEFFQNKAFVFPFSPNDLEEMDQYLQTSIDQHFTFILLDILKKVSVAKVLKDEELNQQKKGIAVTISILKTCAQDPYLKELPEIKIIIADAGVKKLFTEDFALNSVVQIAGCERLFRKQLRSLLVNLMSIIYHFDLYTAVSGVCRSRDFSYATALPPGTHVFHTEGMWHPRIDAAVANVMNLDQEQNVIFLTGANMAGKSTMMKTFGINCYLAHMGFPVAAKNLNFSVKQGMYSSINISDNLNMGYSHFYAEVLRVKEVAEEVSRAKSLYVIFDELFKGTNVKDAYDATLAVTQAFSEYKNCFFIISTHITEVGELLSSTHPAIQFKYMPTLMNGTKPAYTYQLRTGMSTDRQGMMIIENEGILELLNNKGNY